MTDDDRRHQPIEMRMPNGGREASYRELLLEVVARVGAIGATVDHIRENGRQSDDKLDILADKVDELNATVQRGVGDGRLQDKLINDIVVILDGNDRKPGLISKVDDLEKAQASVKYTAIGVAIGSGIGSTALGAWIGKLLGLWGTR